MAWSRRVEPRRGLGVLAALLLATLALAVLSVQAVRREALVRNRLIVETHVGIAELVTARLNAAMNETDRAILADLDATVPEADALLKILQGIEVSRPWLQPLVLVSEGRVKSSSPSADRTDIPARQAELPASQFRTLLAAAEHEEHRLRRLDRAAPLYAAAAAHAPRARERTEALNGQARTELKVGHPARALGTYKTLIAAARTLDEEQTRRSLIARQQIVACYRLLGDGSASASATLDFYEFLIGRRFILGDDTFDFYRRNVDEMLVDATPALERGQIARLAGLRERAQQLDLLASSVRELSAGAALLSGLSGEQQEDRRTVRYFATSDARDRVMAVIAIDDSRAKTTGSGVLVAHLWTASNVTTLLERLLSESGPWSEIGIALLDGAARPTFSSMKPVPADAARATVALTRSPGRRVAAFPRSGSLGALATRDVLRYAALLTLVFGTVVIALLLAVRSVSRELTLSRLRSEFVASVSHELKTPLSLIRMYAESLHAGWVPDAKRAEYYEVITRESERLTGLINNVLTFSRIESGARRYRPVRTDLRQVLVALLDRYRFHLKAANIELIEELPSEAMYADVDGEAIDQALANLLSNAVKYIGDTGRQPRLVRVSMRRDSDRASIQVIDTGIGITGAHRAHIFERFYRANDERVRAVAGSGLGLTLVKHIIEAHDGTIAVESVPDHGSTFAITLPLANSGGGS